MPAPGTPAPRAAEAVAIRPLRRADLAEVVRIHALHTGTRAPAYWEAVLRRVRREGEALEVALVAPSATGRGLAGFLVGEVRAFEFGSEACGWVFAIGVDPDRRRAGVASALLDAADERFRRAGVERARTMVRRNDVPLLALFRSHGWRGGPFVQLERDLNGA